MYCPTDDVVLLPVGGVVWRNAELPAAVHAAVRWRSVVLWRRPRAHR